MPTIDAELHEGPTWEPERPMMIAPGELSSHPTRWRRGDIAVFSGYEWEFAYATRKGEYWIKKAPLETTT